MREQCFNAIIFDCGTKGMLAEERGEGGESETRTKLPAHFSVAFNFHN